MPNLIAPGTKIRNLKLRFVPFKKVRVNQIFYSDFRWYQKISQQIAITADSVESERRRIKAKVIVRVMDEGSASSRIKKGMSFDEFIQNAAL